MVETSHSHCKVASSVHGQGTKILHAVQHDQKKKKKFSSDYTNALFLAQDKSLGYRLKKGEALSSQNLGKPHRLEFPAHPWTWPRPASHWMAGFDGQASASLEVALLLSPREKHGCGSVFYFQRKQFCTEDMKAHFISQRRPVKVVTMCSQREGRAWRKFPPALRSSSTLGVSDWAL